MHLTRLVAVAVVILSTACMPEEEDRTVDAVPDPDVPTEDYSMLFREVATLNPYQPADSPIIRLSGLEFGPNGEFLVADVSEGHVRHFAADGSLIRIIGRKGNGPGEFIAPRFARFGADGRIHVADSQEGLVSRFSRDGSYEDRVRIPLVPIMGFDLSSAGQYVVTGARDTLQAVLHVYDPAGNLEWSAVPIARTLPAGRSENALYDMFRWFHLAVAGDTAYVSATILDSLWTVDLGTRAVGTRSLAFSGYSRPEIPDEGFRDRTAMVDWYTEYHTAVTPLVTPDVIAVPFVKGVLNEGDPTVVVVLDRGGEWVRPLTGAPPMVATRGREIVAIANPLQDPVRLLLLQVTTTVQTAARD